MIPFPEKRYRTLYLDPPWPEKGGGQCKRGADKHYPVMSVQEIYNLPIMNITAQRAHIYLWVTNNFLEAGLRCFKEWGFLYVTTITWMKDSIGLGQYFRGNTEHCLFGTTFEPLPYKMDPEGHRFQGVTGFTAPKAGHSVKPEIMRKMIEEVSYPEYIELFARRKTPGWDVWGNEV